MPDPTISQELHLRASQCPAECSNGLAYKEKRVEQKLQERDSHKQSKLQHDPTQFCRTKLAESAARAIVSNETEDSAGNEVSETAAIICRPELGPLGPIPCTSDNSAPPEYWAPLADLTKSRPAVENLSVTRYSSAEWHRHNDNLLKDSFKSVDKELLAEYKTHCCMERVFAQTDRDQQDNNIKLNARLSLVGRWKVELQREIAEFGSEINAIQEEKKRLMRCSHALTLIESIDKDVKKVRCNRIEAELVRDEVEEELSNELDLCADVENVYVRCLDQVKIQLQELKDAKRRLEMDLTDKNEAWNLDVTCRSLSSTSRTLGWKPGSVEMPADQSTSTTYEDYCKNAIDTSQTTLQRSRILRSNLHDTYEKSVHDLRTQADRLDMALTRKIDEIVQICRRIENELSRCLKALADAEALLDEARAGTKRLDGAMKCAQTRLSLRSNRNKVENCRDIPQFGLIGEVKTLSEGVSSMLSHIENASSTIDDLTKARGALEKDLVAKRKSLWVDRDRVQLLRSFYPTIQVLAGH